MNENLKNIQKVVKAFSSTMITVEEFQAALSDIVNAFAQHRSSFGEMSKKSEETLNNALKNLQDEFDKVRADVQSETGMTKEEVSKMIKSALSDVKKAIKEVEMMQPIDGKDADEEKIVGEVLAKIKLPENKVLTPEETRDMLEALEGEERLDAKAIKNLPELKQQIIQDVRRGVSQRVVAGTNVTITTDGNGQQVISTTGGASDTAAQILIKLLTVDGAGSGLDADLLDGNSSAAFATSAQGTTADNALPKSGGTMTGNITLGENTSIDLDPAGSADGKYSGICITGTAGATLAFGDLIYLAVADSRWELTDADATATSGTPLIGMCVLAAAGDGSATKILLQGTIRADAKFPALTIGAPAYVGETAGAIQTAIPTGADNVIRVVGRALTADELYFCPSQDHQVTVA